MIDRRQLLYLSAAFGALNSLGSGNAWAKAGQMNLGGVQPFDFGILIARAKALSGEPYKAPVVRHDKLLDNIDYDAFQQISFRREMGIGEGSDVDFPAQLFHLGRYFKAPVKIHTLENGMAREVVYQSSYFSFGKTDLEKTLPGDLGFSGFRLQNGQNGDTDWLAFLGGAYFRSSGELNQYGLSARAVAVDTALSSPEEFPRFSEFWLEPGKRGSNKHTIYALMDGPSICGAYRIVCTKTEKVQMEVTSELFAREDIKRLGIAPLTSMFWFGENNRNQAKDWRPEIHDSDGLAIWTGSGERIWRPLNNPPNTKTNSFSDANPKGFGLLQRDRAFSNFEDDGVFYDRRPSVWVEPLSDWGKGVVQLVEIPTDDEIHDNIVAYWLPDEPVSAGWHRTFKYRLFWNKDEPYPSNAVARVAHTRLGHGGVPGQPRPKGVRKFVIDFSGGPLEGLVKTDKVKPVISASTGRVSNDYALQIVGSKIWRAFFDLDVAGEEPVDLRLYLQLGDNAISETWLYQYHPYKDA